MSDTLDIVQRLKDAQQQLTGPGAPFEIEERQLNGVALRSYKTAPVTLRDALAEGRKHGDKIFLTYADERYSFDDFFAAADRLANTMVNRYNIAQGCRNSP